MTHCAECDAPLAAGQRFCLSCGARVGPPLPAALGLERRPELVAAAPAAPPRPPFLVPSPPVAAITVLAMLGFGVFLAAEAGPRADVSLAAARAPIVLELPAPAAPVAPVAAPASEPTPQPEPEPLAEAPAPVETTPPAPPAPAETDTAPTETTGGGDDATEDAPAATDEPAATAPPIEHVWVLRLAEHADQLPSLADDRLQGGWLSGFEPIGDGGLADVVALLSGQRACLDPLLPCAFGPDVPTVLDQLTANDRSWRGYVEDLLVSPPSCQQQPPTPGDPFGAFASLAASTECVPLAQLTTDLAPPGAQPNAELDLPSLSLVLPGLAKVDPAVADPWLTQTIAEITATKAYADGGLIVVELADGVLLLSKYVSPGTETDSAYDALSLLRTLQDVFGLQPLEQSADATAFDDKVWTGWSQDVHEKATTS